MTALEAAQADPAYKAAEAHLGGDAIMDRTAKNRGLTVIRRPPLATDPKTLCL